MFTFECFFHCILDLKHLWNTLKYIILHKHPLRISSVYVTKSELQWKALKNFTKQILMEVGPSTVVYLNLRTSEIKKLYHSLNFKQMT